MLEVWDARLNASDATRHPPAVLAVIARAWVDAATAEAQAVGAATARRRRPIAPAGITVADRRTIHVPGIDEVVWVRTIN